MVANAINDIDLTVKRRQTYCEVMKQELIYLAPMVNNMLKGQKVRNIVQNIRKNDQTRRW